MADPYLSELRIFAFNFAPRTWAQCNGQILPINSNQALFSLIGTIYGGDGRVNFALPELRGRVPVHFDSGFSMGQKGGEETHSLLANEIPAHTHQAMASTAGPTVSTPAGNYWASNTGFAPYGSGNDLSLNAGAVSTVGANQAHENRAPYLALNICICIQGIFPSRN